MTRRQLLRTVAAAPVMTIFAGSSRAYAQALNPHVVYGATTIPAGIRSRIITGVNGITMHALEAGFESANRPGVLLIHGFPELAYSWRHVMVPLANAGYHVIAPDLRGYGRSGGTDVKFDDDLAPFSTLNRVRDMLALVAAFGHRFVAAVAGHDFGSPTAGWCALTRPDVFRSVVMMSAPYGGAPAFARANPDELRRGEPAAARQNQSELRRANPQIAPSSPVRSLDDELAALPEPRKHYQAYYTTREANENMWHPRQGVHNFLRGYYHMKSADWPANKPFPLTANTAAELAKLPRYYVMDLNKGMAESVANEMPTADQIATCAWLTEEELKIYSGEYGRTGFQGGLQSYRVGRVPRLGAELQLFAGRTIDVPSLFLSGTSDWGVYQRAGSLDAMRRACTTFDGVELIDGAGHWVQQEKAAVVAGRLVTFVRAHAGA
jgi:pimeloyl-ACP methyl ester carboxylesterase